MGDVQFELELTELADDDNKGTDSDDDIIEVDEVSPNVNILFLNFFLFLVNFIYLKCCWFDFGCIRT